VSPVYIHIHTNTHTHTHTHTCTHTRTHTQTHTHTHTHTHKTPTHMPKDVTEVEEDIMFIAHYMGRPSTHVSSLRQHQAVVSCFFHFFFPLPSATTKKKILQITLEKAKIVTCADNSEIKKNIPKKIVTCADKDSHVVTCADNSEVKKR
jgi:hypothetical protein